MKKEQDEAAERVSGARHGHVGCTRKWCSHGYLLRLAAVEPVPLR